MGRKEKLTAVVVDSSEADDWDLARGEWEVVDGDVTPDDDVRCVCMQKPLVYLFKIRNWVTGKEIYPIGSSCVKRFMVQSMTKDVNRLVRAAQNRIEDMGKRRVTKGQFEGYLYKDVPDYYMTFIAKNARHPPFNEMVKYYILRKRTSRRSMRSQSEDPETPSAGS